MALTDRDLDIIETLTCRVPLLTFQQATRLWWPDCMKDRTARRRFEKLSQSKWISQHVVNITPLSTVTEPLFAWAPGIEAPDAVALAQQAQARRRNAARPTQVLAASPPAAAMMGSTAHGLPAPQRRDHYVNLAAVYVLYRTKNPNLARQWVGEHARAKSSFRQRTVDAVLRGPDASPIGLIHVAGRWEPHQVERFHDFCQQSNLPYELW